MNLAVSSIDKIVSGSRWATTIGAICDSHGGEIQTGPFGSQLHASDYTDDGTPVVMPRDMQDGTIVCDQIARIPQKHVDRLRQHVLLDGDVVYSRRGDVTRFAVVTPREQGWLCGTGSIRIRLNCSDLEIGYVRQYLRQDAVGAWLEHHAKGVTMANLNTSIVRALPFVYPPLTEQRRIAEVLDRAETLRTKRRAALAHLDTLTQAIFLDLFGDSNSVLTRWPTTKLGELLTYLTSGSRGWATHYAESGALFLRIQNVRRDELVLEDVAYVSAPDSAEAKRTRVQPGDVLLSITADLGRTAVIPEGIQDAFINQHLSILRTKVLHPRFLSAYLASPVGQRQIFGRNRHGVKAGLNFDDIRSFVVPAPPVAVQQDFARRIAAVEKLKSTQRASLAELDALFASLQHRAFRGEL